MRDSMNSKADKRRKRTLSKGNKHRQRAEKQNSMMYSGNSTYLIWFIM